MGRKVREGRGEWVGFLLCARHTVPNHTPTLISVHPHKSKKTMALPFYKLGNGGAQRETLFSGLQKKNIMELRLQIQPV